MFRCHFKSSAGVVDHHIAEIAPPTVLLCEEVAADAAAHIEMFDLGVCRHLTQEVYHRLMVAVEILAQGGHRTAVS